MLFERMGSAGWCFSLVAVLVSWLHRITREGRNPMSYKEIAYDVADNIATLTLHRPDKLNAFTGVMMAEMIDAFDKADSDDTVRVVIVTGAGRAFCAGADLSAGAKTFDYAARSDRPEKAGAETNGEVDWSSEAVRDGGGRLTLRIFESKKPVIGAINGAAVGVGATMQLPMDIRIASETARFGFVFARRGIVPEACSSWFLPRLVGISKAMEWCTTGRVFDAQEALAGGLVSKVVKPEDLLETARTLAREIADNTAPVSIALTRQMLWRMLGADHPMEAHKIDSRAIFARGRQGDAREGVVSFLEKRPANFPDRVSKDMPVFYPWWNERKYS
jgi:enoyl-CoA hydratase/carnithine racemase